MFKENSFDIDMHIETGWAVLIFVALCYAITIGPENMR